MAIFQTDFYSESLTKHMNVKVIIPNDVTPEMIQGNENYNRNMKTLYLLHGYSGSSNAWITGSNIEEMAIKYNLAVVMPSGDNSFYLDAKGRGRSYCQYVGKELVEYMNKTFGFSDKKEDTYIGGISMGGFGAIHTGLYFPNTFGKVVGLSSALIIHNIKDIEVDYVDQIADYHYYESVFGDLNKLEESDNNPEYLVHKLKKAGEEIPPIYMACGTEDFLIEENRSFYSFLKEEKVAVDYIESPGVHDWAFWNKYLEPSIQWLLK